MTQTEASPAAREYMTTREVAEYLRLKERRVYELVRQGAIPCTRVTGKWLFPKDLVDDWLADKVTGARPARPPPVIAGSQDPLLDWAVKESDCGLALLPGGSLDGLTRLARGEAVAAGLHLFDPESGEFNLPALRADLPDSGRPRRDLARRDLPRRGLVLLEWARRQQGLVVPAGNPAGLRGLEDLKDDGPGVILRQETAGSHRLLLHLLARAGLGLNDLKIVAETARGETDLGLAILEGRAQAGLAVAAVARGLNLDFVPLMWERYDLLVRRRDYFEPPLQALLDFARSRAFRARAARMGGYDISGLGRVRYNQP